MIMITYIQYLKMFTVGLQFFGLIFLLVSDFQDFFDPLESIQIK